MPSTTGRMCTTGNNKNNNNRNKSNKVAITQRFMIIATTTTTTTTTAARAAGAAAKRPLNTGKCSPIRSAAGVSRGCRRSQACCQVSIASAVARWLLLAVVSFACLSFPQVVSANGDGVVGSSRDGRDDSSIEEGHVSPGTYAMHSTTRGAARSLWWPAAVSVSTQALLRHIGLPHSQTHLSSLTPLTGTTVFLRRSTSPYAAASSSNAASASSRLQQQHKRQKHLQQQQRKSKRGSRRAGEHPEHSNPQIPTTGVRAPRGAHEYDVPQIGKC